MRPPGPCTASWTALAEWFVPHRSSRGVIPCILWGGFWLQKGCCSWYGWASALYSSQRLSPLVLCTHYNFKVICLNSETYQIALVLQIRDDLTIEIENTVQRNRDLFLESLLDLAQRNCWRNDGSVDTSIFGGFITMPTLSRIILEVGNYEFSISNLSGFLEKLVASNRNRTMQWDIKWIFREI